MTTKTAPTKHVVEARPMSVQETLAQIGHMNVLAASGGRVATYTDCDCGSADCATIIVLPVTDEVAVAVTLNAWDLYDVSRIATDYLGQDPRTCEVTWELGDIDLFSVGEAVYQASCFLSYP